MIKRLGPSLVGVCLAVMMVQAKPLEAAEARAPDRTCGVLPGDGYYNYVKVWGMSCPDARRISEKAGRKFCGPPYKHCNGQPGEFDTGRVRVGYYQCEMRVGVDFYRARCGSDGAGRFVHESAA